MILHAFLPLMAWRKLWIIYMIFFFNCIWFYSLISSFVYLVRVGIGFNKLLVLYSINDYVSFELYFSWIQHGLSLISLSPIGKHFKVLFKVHSRSLIYFFFSKKKKKNGLIYFQFAPSTSIFNFTCGFSL